MRLTIQWHPTIPGQVDNDYLLSFEDEDSDDVSSVSADAEFPVTQVYYQVYLLNHLY